MEKTHESRQIDALVRVIGVLVGFVAVACVFLAAIYVLRLGALPLKYALIIFGVDALLTILPLYLLLNGRNSVKKSLCIILSALMAVLNLFVVSYGDLTYNFLNDQFTLGSTGNIEYSVIARSSSQINLENSASRAYVAGIQTTDICRDEAEAAMQKLALIEFTEYNNVSELIDATIDGGVEVAVMQTVFLDTFASYFPESFEQLSILTTFRTESKVNDPSIEGIAVDITKPFAIYVSGADDYGDIDQTARSDVNMLVLIDPEHYRMMLVNTPRDYYVQLHDSTGLPDKLTHAGIYGIEVSEATIEDLYDINVDYHVHINYDTLINLINRLGGITLDNPEAFNLWGAQFDKGVIYMNGEHALLYARARKQLSDGDNGRGENQQRVIEAIVNRVSAAHIAVQYTQILETLSGTFRSNIPPTIIGQLFQRQISLGGHWTIDKISVVGTPGKQPTYSMGSDMILDVVLPDMNSVHEASEKMKMFLRGEDPQIESD